METLEIRSKDFLVKWVNAPDNSVIDWQVKPLKKSISLMIYKKVEEDAAVESENDENHFKPPSASFVDDEGSSASLNSQNSRNGRLRSNSILLVNQVTNSKNIYKTKSRSVLLENIHNQDLTLLKDYSKLIPNELVHGKFTVTKGGMFAFIFDNSFSKTIAKKVLFSTKLIFPELNKPSFDRRAISHIRNFSNKITPSSENQSKDIDAEKSTKNKGKDDLMRPKNGELLQSVLLKRRKKKLQGFTKRFFVLNFKYGTLSYFRVNDNKLRGQMPIKHSVISANSKNREIIIDSGMEVWDLKCLNDQNFKAWVEAFNDVKRYHFTTSDVSSDAIKDENDMSSTDIESILQKLEILQSSCMTDSRESISEQLNHLSSDLKKLMSSSKSIRRQSNVPDVLSMLSGNNEFYDAKEYIDSMYTEVVILDKKKDVVESLLDGRAFPSDDSLEEASSNGMDSIEDDADVASEVSSNSSASVMEVTNEKLGNLVPHDDLYPLPHEPVKRESDIPVFDHPPPSLLGFIRKNIGKDLSTIAMPVDMNEPLTILQKYSEMFEYCDLINNALSSDISNSPEEKILRIATFATTYLSGMRSKLRNCRKPFTPLLGETFELVREDFGMRLLSEKICHRPAIYAIHAESKDWIFTFSPSPNQKIWGKNAEIVTKGTARLTDKSTGEVFSWQHPTTLLKNMIAGEKYSEPSSSMTVRSDSGYKAVVDFAKGGMFSGRSEDVTISAYSPQKELLKYSVTGKWTESMTLKTKTTEKLIWKVGELLPHPSKKFGFTEFAGTLNKITDLERDKLPPNDSRLRPDMQHYEIGNIDEAEKLKNSLEQKQRERRSELEHSGKTYKPLFFKEVDGDSNDTKEWVMIEGEKSYWNRRKNNDWSDIPKLW